MTIRMDVEAKSGVKPGRQLVDLRQRTLSGREDREASRRFEILRPIRFIVLLACHGEHGERDGSHVSAAQDLDLVKEHLGGKASCRRLGRKDIMREIKMESIMNMNKFVFKVLCIVSTGRE